MPIANCFVAQGYQIDSRNIVEIWAIESSKPAKHMTVNIISSSQQLGNQYAVMSNLLLPSMWSASDISSLQIGLARALAKSFAVNLDQIHVVTTIVNSGMVVENGQEVVW